MYKIHAVLKRLPKESTCAFGNRCANFLELSDFSTPAIATRMSLDGNWLVPVSGADSCVVATLDPSEIEETARFEMSDCNWDELESAPENPHTYPRMAHRMSLEEFSNSACLVKSLLPAKNWEVFLDGKSLGFGDVSEVESIYLVHRRAVVAALYGCTDAAPKRLAGSVLPTQQALEAHPEMALNFPREVALVGAVWGDAHSEKAASEGWELVEESGTSDSRYLIQRMIGTTQLDDDAQAREVVMSGTDESHIVARTALFEKSPAAYLRIRSSLESLAGYGDMREERMAEI